MMGHSKSASIKLRLSYVLLPRSAKNKAYSSVLNRLYLVDIYLVVRVPDCGTVFLDRKNKLFTINDKSLEWLKFGEFGELIKFAKLSSANLL